jgi:hypothetical protein
MGQFEEEGNACLVTVEVCAMKKGSFFEKFFAMVSCDCDDRVFEEGFFMEGGKKAPEKRIDVVDRVPVAVFNEFNFFAFGSDGKVVDLF